MYLSIYVFIGIFLISHVFMWHYLTDKVRLTQRERGNHYMIIILNMGWGKFYKMINDFGGDISVRSTNSVISKFIWLSEEFREFCL